MVWEDPELPLMLEWLESQPQFERIGDEWGEQRLVARREAISTSVTAEEGDDKLPIGSVGQGTSNAWTRISPPPLPLGAGRKANRGRMATNRLAPTGKDLWLTWAKVK